MRHILNVGLLALLLAATGLSAPCSIAAPAVLLSNRPPASSGSSGSSGSSKLPESSEPSASPPIRSPVVCPDRLESLMPLLLRDLPSYANRVSQRAYTDYRTTETPGYVLLAGRPEYEPLSLAAGEYQSVTESDVPQVFFTTLERQYFSGEVLRLQHYHWLFLARTENGWRFVMMLSTIGNERADEPPTPPRDSSQGVLAQAIRIWLRDCEAGGVGE